jgi:hypothetical protein
MSRPKAGQHPDAVKAVRAAAAEVKSAELQLRSVIDYALGSGCTFGEVGGALGITKQALWNRLYRVSRTVRPRP